MCARAGVRRLQAGLTLIEMIMSMVVIGVGVALFVSVFAFSIRSSADPMQRKQALAVAESMLNEIVSKPFAKLPVIRLGPCSPDEFKDDFRRFLENRLRDAFGFDEIPLRISFRKRESMFVED